MRELRASGPKPGASEGGTAAVPPSVLDVKSVSKHFGGVRALASVDIAIQQGVIHGLLGENGSGKSTLIKVLAGFHVPDEGELLFHGDRVEMPLDSAESRRLGMHFVHQDLGLVPSLTVVENMCLEYIATPQRRWHMSLAAQADRVAALFAEHGLAVDPRASVADLRPVVRAQIAIVRALDGLRDGNAAGVDDGESRLVGKLLVLDEPTAFLPRHEAEELFSLVRGIAAAGGSVLFVSHDLDEVRRLTDVVTVLRDGRLVGTAATAEVSQDQLVEMIVGRTLATAQSVGSHDRPVTREAGASVRQLTGETLRDVSFDVGAGEIVGITGLLGSGFEEVPYLLFGAVSTERGTLAMDGEEIELSHLTPDQAVARGMALIPADRQSDGSLPSMSVMENLMLRRLSTFFRNGRLRRGQMTADAKRVLVHYGVRPPEPAMRFDQLSGGNQQKVVLAKWLTTEPKLLLLHEPTQGVDIGARQNIYGLIAETVKHGMMVVVASSDHEELAAISDRVLVVARGRVIAELAGSELTKDRLTTASLAQPGADDVQEQAPTDSTVKDEN